jgi:small subunit ribosomal protein S5
VTGVGDILSKCIGSNNPHNVVKATVNALSQLKSAEQIMTMRGLGGQNPESAGQGE